MCEKLRLGRENGRRESMVIVSEGATDRSSEPITAQRISDVISERLQEEPRITALGHVQRGGKPSAYDRWMPTLLGYAAARYLILADDDTEPVIIGTHNNRIVRLPMMQAVENTRAVKTYLKDGGWDEAINSR